MSDHNRKPPTEDELRSRWLHRRGSGMNFGLQGKLLLSFLALIALALGSSSWLSSGQNEDQLNTLMSEQARLMAYTLSLAAEPALEHGKKAELETIGQDLLKSRNLLYVAFLDADKKPVAMANRYADFVWKDTGSIGTHSNANEAPQLRNSDQFGDYLDIATPVIQKAIQKPGPKKTAVDKTVGYVVVGVSLQQVQASLSWVNWMMLDVGVAVVLLSLPLAFGLVYSIFRPIRQLVGATRKMASGRLDIKLEIHRDDMIGELAHSFEEMVSQVGRQREDLAYANTKLEEANAQLAVTNDQLAHSNLDLEDKVRQRTTQLEASNGRLTAEIAEKEDFIRAVSHDLNAPLRNIGGMTTMLLAKHKNKFEPDIVHRLERIQKNVQVETELISELLELSRIKSRRQRMELVDMETVVSDLADMFENDLRSKQIQLMLDTPLPPLTAERSRIRQVLQNLIDNAIKYMGNGPAKEIHIGCTINAIDAEFYVRDTGMGIDAEDVGKVFNVFRRGKTTGVQAVAGKGVGLASVKSIIEMYSGRIWVESHPGQGSTFKFTLDGQHVSGCRTWQSPETMQHEVSSDEVEESERKAA
jgi:signal transduction histidine kinase